MKLERKKEFAAKTLGVGKGRITFNKERLSEIKEAITKQDIRDLLKDEAIAIKEITGRRTKKKRRTRRRAGSIKKKAVSSKQKYVILTRKLRAYLSELRKHGTISDEQFKQLRKEIRTGEFRSKTHLKERISQ